MQLTHADYNLTDDTHRMDAAAVHAMLIATYWAGKRTLDQVERSIKNSLCLGLFHAGRQVGFARAITDYATISWLCDVVIDPAHRGGGRGKWMMTTLVQHPAIAGTRMFLVTKDAQGVYRPLGFETHPFECMIRPEQ